MKRQYSEEEVQEMNLKILEALSWCVGFIQAQGMSAPDFVSKILESYTKKTSQTTKLVENTHGSEVKK